MCERTLNSSPQRLKPVVTPNLTGGDWFERRTSNGVKEKSSHLKLTLILEVRRDYLSAIAHLKRLIVLCDVLRIDSLLSYKDYVIRCLHANLGSAQKNCREYLRSNMATLEQPEYHREIYSNLSATILPLFEENNHLWKIILHFGDMRKWDSPEELFDHLLHTSDDSYSVSLRKLYNLLL